MMQYTEKDFERVLNRNLEESEAIYEEVNFFKDAIGRFKQNKMAVVGAIIILVIFLLSIFGPMMNEHTYRSIINEHSSLPPRVPVLEKLGIMDGVMYDVNQYEKRGLEDVYYIFGTDTLGRDLWTRVWTGTRVSFFIAFLAVAIDMVIGVTYGMVSGYIGGRTDLVMQRIIEIISGIPNLVVVTLLVIVLKPGIISISIALIITGWIGMSRVVRSQVLKLKNLDFILASQTLGTSKPRILLLDIFPNVFGQVIIMSMFSVPSAIFYESFLAFIGLGLQPPLASLGVLINDGYKSLLTYPHMVFFPVLVLSLLMLSFNFVADGLRDAFDPKIQER